MASPSMTSLGLTGDRVIDSITNGYKWGLDSSRTVDFSISNGFAGEYWYRPGELALNITAIFELCSYYSNIRFNYLGYFSTPSIAAANGSEINVSLDGVGRFFSSNTQWAIGFFPNSSYNTTRYSGAPGDIFINVNSGANSLPSYAPGSQGWFLFLHEIGHTLGLKHPHDDGGTGRPTFNNLGLGTLNQDWATVMSYNDDGAWNPFSWDPATPMLLDVIGLMYLYGKNESTNAGDSTFRLTESNTYLSIWDASGIDTLDASSALSGWTILIPDKTISNLVDVKVGFALPTSQLFSSVPNTLSWIIGDYENAVGSSYDDEIVGNSFNNQISGGFGNDEILGGLGDDFIDGGPGVDTAFFQSSFASAQISYSSSTGRYSVITTEGADSLKDVEYLQFSDRSIKSSESLTAITPTYSLVVQGSTTIDEGQSAVFTLSTTNIASGTSVAYLLTGVSNADIVGGSLSGSVIVSTSGQATISIPIAADNLTEGNETLTVTAQGQSTSVTVKDTSTTPALMSTYSLSASSSSVSEGQTANFTLSTTNVAVGTLVTYSISGVSGADIVGGFLSGSATVGSNGQAIISIPIAADSLTEGDEVLTVATQGKIASVAVNDSSRSVITSQSTVSLSSGDDAYTIRGTTPRVINALDGNDTVWIEEGAGHTINLGSGNDTLQPYKNGPTQIFPGLTYADGGSGADRLNLSFLGADQSSVVEARNWQTLGEVTVSYPSGGAAETFKTSGIETLFYESAKRFTAYASGNWNNFYGDRGSRGEAGMGEGVDVVYPGLFASYSVNLSADIRGGVSLVDARVDERATPPSHNGVDNSSSYVRNIKTLTFSDKSFDISVENGTAKMSPKGGQTSYNLSVGASVYEEGQTVLFSLTSAAGLAGSTVNYTVSGVTAADLTSGALSGSVVLGPEGRATISLPIAADRLTEGNETLTVSVGSVSASATIRDTSTALTSTTSGATKTYAVASTQASVRSSDGGATWTVTTPSGVENLTAPDRLRFSDKTIALDFDRGEAGHKTVTMIGAAFGKPYINQYFGTGVSLFDSGQSMAQIAQLVISTGLIESMVGSSNSAWVRHIYKNVIGANPDAFAEAVYTTYLDNGTYTKAGLLELAAGVSALETQIDLVGIRAEGIGYIPFI